MPHLCAQQQRQRHHRAVEQQQASLRLEICGSAAPEGAMEQHFRLIPEDGAEPRQPCCADDARHAEEVPQQDGQQDVDQRRHKHNIFHLPKKPQRFAVHPHGRDDGAQVEREQHRRYRPCVHQVFFAHPDGDEILHNRAVRGDAEACNRPEEDNQVAEHGV